MASTVCFIVGHGKSKTGGYDSGAVSPDGRYHEFKIVKEIAKYAQARFNELFVEQADLMNYNGDLYLADRIKKANKAGYKFVAEIHMNAQYGGTDANGTECYYSNGSKSGQKCADMICDYIAAKLGVVQRKNWTDDDGGDKVKLNSAGDDYFGIIRQTNAEAVLVETVFITNASDLTKVSTAAGQKMCGEAIAEAVGKALGAELKKEASANQSKPQTTTQTAAPTSHSIKKGDLVKIADSATYYGMTKAVPAWVRNLKWYVYSVDGNRIVLGGSEDSKYYILSPVHAKYLTIASVSVKQGDTVKIKSGATDYNGKTLKSFVYGRKYKVKELKNDRAVLTYLGITVAAVNIADIYKA